MRHEMSSLLVHVVAFAAAALMCTAGAPNVVNVTIPYDFDSMRCAGDTSGNGTNLLIAVQWNWLVGIAPSSGQTVWNWTVAEKYSERDGVSVGPTFGHVMVLYGRYTWSGVDIKTGAMLWKVYAAGTIGYAGDNGFSYIDEAGGYLWLLKYSKAWLAAVSLLSGVVVKNVTLSAYCNKSSYFVAVHYPYALLRDMYFHDSNDTMRTECMVDLRRSAAAPVLWVSTYNETVTKFYELATISGNCTDVAAPPSSCLIIRLGQEIQQDGYYLRFARTYVASTGAVSASNLRAANGIDACYIDGYTEFSNVVDVVAQPNGFGSDPAYPAGAAAVRCYTSNPSMRVRTNLVNVSNFTQQWGRYTRIPVNFDGDRVLISPTVTWAVVNQGNWVAARSVSIDAYVTATGERPGAAAAGTWPLWFPGYMLERMDEKTSCSAGNYFVMVARNESLMDPYIKTVVFVTVD
jgi:hypothetical protein